MPGTHHVVVDGSNLATEGRTTPSLRQLDEAVRAYVAEDPSADVVVVVDASFSHRIDPNERAQLEAAELHGELVAPPAGAIGRGDAFVLRIAERTGAVVLSNDSFQEFHDEHPWLFDEGRLIGGKPVPGVGWIFTPRRPVRGPKSRKSSRQDTDEVDDGLSAPRKAAEVAKALKRAAKPATRAKAEPKLPVTKPAKKKAQKTPALAKEATKSKEAAKKKRPTSEGTTGRSSVAKASGKRAAKAEATTKRRSAADPSPKAEKSKKATAAAKSAKVADKKPKAAKASSKQPAPVALRAAIDRATEEVLAPVPAEAAASNGASAKAKRRRRVAPPPAVNEPLAFINFVAEHPLGSVIEGVVASFTSHGAMIDVALDGGGVLHCYAPLAGLGSPAPRAARDVLTRGERRAFTLVSLDPPRRMAELALAQKAGSSSKKTAR
jgi:hypothetical protein